VTPRRSLFALLLLAGCGDPARSSADASGTADSGAPEAAAACVTLPPECRLDGAWTLTHSEPDQPCQFGGADQRFDLTLASGALCLAPGGPFQRLERGPGEGCALTLLGETSSKNPSETYHETWRAELTFTSVEGTGRTLYTITGGSNCQRTFKTRAARRGLSTGN
jgi:hypothetical protein